LNRYRLKGIANIFKEAWQDNSYKLTNKNIEKQVRYNLLKYAKEFEEKYQSLV